jgi:Fe-S cluster assembly protein SufD
VIETAERFSDKQGYLETLAGRGQHNVPEWLRTVREAGAKRFASLPFPSRRDEAWRFTDIKPLLESAFGTATEAPDEAVDLSLVESHLFNEAGWTELVFVNGFFAPELSRVSSNGPVHVGSLAESAATNGTLAQQHLDRLIGETGDVFNALNSAFLLDGAIIHARRGHAVEMPIHILYVTTGREGNKAVHPRNLIVLDEMAEITVIESYVGLTDTPYLNNVVTETSLANGAVLKRYKVLQEGPQGYHLSSTRVNQDKNSVFRSFSAFLGGKIGRNELKTRLSGEGATAFLSGLYLAEGDQLIDSPTTIEHASPHGTSRIHYKGVLSDSSHAVFSGRIYVHHGAQKTDSNQLNSNMLLSDKATIDTKPLLEIFADDVKCTHGATVGQPSSNQIFYLKTRGISEEMARALLTCGFAGEVVDTISVNPLRTRLHNHVYNRYSP